MACVTLKRPVEMLGSPHLMENEPIVKRRRCGMSLFPTTPPGTHSEHLRSDYPCPQSGSSSPGLTRHHGVCGSPLSVSRGCKRAKRKLDIDHYSIRPSSPPVSPFLSATPPIEADKLVAQLGQELKRLQRRKYQLSEDAPLQQQPNQALSSSPVNNPNSSIKDQPLFTLKQVTIVCQRMIREREELIRSEYDKVLTTKLAEQYDTFVKFSHDQVEKRLAESAFSYVS